MKLFPTKEIAALCGVARETFISWDVKVAGKRGRMNLYSVPDVLENRVQRREDVVRAELARKERANGGAIRPRIDEAALEDEVRAELAKWVSQEMFPRLWSHWSMYWGVLGYGVDELGLTVEQTWNLLSFVMVASIGAHADGFQADCDGFECMMPDWFDELAALGKANYLAKLRPEVEQMIAERRIN